MESHTSTPVPSDPVALIRQLDPGSIKQRIDELDRERRALLTLLRAARAGRGEQKEVVRA